MKRKADAAAAPAAKKARVTIAVDASVPNAKTYSVVGDFNAKLNQTDIAGNHNKYYFIQLLSKGGQYFSWTRWGRVGYSAGVMTNLDGPHKAQAGAEKAFRSKFRSKTGNDWDKRASFVAKSGKYTLIDVDETDSKGKAGGAASGGGKTSLNKDVASVLKVIFDQNMFKKEMEKKKVDVAKLPLGKLSKAQIAKGNAILGKIQAEIEKSKKNAPTLSKLSSEFYTLIPHNFGYKKPTSIDNQGIWAEKVDLLNTLNDIELAQHLQGGGKDPLSQSYSKLNNKMTLLASSTKEYKAIEKYFTSTKRHGKLLKVFELERSGEKSRMAQHKSIGNRRLLWHGTSPAVVAAIMGGGLRIMPHSGGRVGKGIYLASEQSKSAGYTGSTKFEGKNAGFMFLIEAALGKSNSILKDDRRLKSAPSGFHSILAEGRTESFNPKTDTKIPGPFGEVAVPQAKPRATSHKTSRFSQSEYLVYKESQALMRFLCVVQMH